MSRMELTGLKAHHPLGFLAACGLLRCLTESRDFGWSRLGWKGSDAGSFAVIDGEGPLDTDSVTRILVCWSKKQLESIALRWSTKIDDKSKYREAAEQALRDLFNGASRDAADMLAALASDVATSDESLSRTSFDLTSGNQRFLESIRVVAGRLATAKEKPALLMKDAIEEALIGPWKYRDDHHSLGWDPNTQRLHALRGKLPEKDKARRSVRAAVFLASQAVPLFPCFTVGGRLCTTGFRRERGEDWFAWPIWREPISLDALRSLLALPLTGNLRARGVEIIYRCRCVHTGGSEGNYQVFGHPEERPWPVESH